MIKKLLYSQFVLYMCKTFFSLIYEKKYLSGKYFDQKRMGWLWAFKAMPGRVVGKNRKIPWPVNRNTIVSSSENIEFDNSSINVFQTPGCYFQCHNAKIIIGKNVHIAPNCGIITTNHNIYNPEEHIDGKSIYVGDYSWIGMNSVILPGVNLGPHTIVGAGSVVTQSFPEGFCVIGGTPARKIKNIDKKLVL